MKDRHVWRMLNQGERDHQEEGEFETHHSVVASVKDLRELSSQTQMIAFRARWAVLAVTMPAS